MDASLPTDWWHLAWEGLRELLDAVDPVAHRNEPTDMTAVARLREAVVTLTELATEVLLTYERSDGKRTASLALHLDTSALIADVQAGGMNRGTGTQEGLIADAAFEIWEIFEHTVWWDGPGDEAYVWGRA